jgi:hypothetical protein
MSQAELHAMLGEPSNCGIEMIAEIRRDRYRDLWM